MFAQKPAPCFFVMFRYEKEKREPAKAYLLHFWEDQIAQCIKRVREAQSLGRNDLHQASFPIQFKSAHEVEFAEIPAQMAQIAGTIKHYAERKQQIYQTIGADDGLLGLKGGFKSTATDEDFFDLQLGFRDNIEIERLELVSSRFGVELPMHPDDNFRWTHLTVERQPKTGGKMRIVLPDGEDLFLPFELISATSTNPNKYEGRVRLKTSILDIVISSDESFEPRLTFTDSFDDEMSLSELSVLINLEVNQAGSSLETMFWMNEKKLFHGSLDLPKKTRFSELADWHEVSSFFSILAEHLPRENWPLDPVYSIKKLSRERFTMRLLISFLRQEKIEIFPHDHKDVEGIRQCRIVTAAYGKFVEFWLAVYVVGDGYPVSNTEGIGLQMKNYEVARCHFFKADRATIANQIVSDEIEELAERVDVKDNTKLIATGPITLLVPDGSEEVRIGTISSDQ